MVEDQERRGPMVELRQQLSSESMLLLKAGAEAQVERLQGFLRELCAVTTDAGARAKVQARIEEWETAIRQLQYVYVDQFPEGRKENDGAGRRGLRRGGQAREEEMGKARGGK